MSGAYARTYDGKIGQRIVKIECNIEESPLFEGDFLFFLQLCDGGFIIEGKKSE